MRRLPILLAGSLGALVACSHPADKKVTGDAAPQGRVETRSIRNSDAVGYSGTSIANKVDGALDTNDHRTADLDKAVEAQQAPDR